MKYPISMELTKVGDSIKGNYHYTKIGTKIDLLGKIDKSNRIKLTESVDGKETGVFEGILTSSEFENLKAFDGEWSSKDRSKRYFFHLYEKMKGEYGLTTVEYQKFQFKVHPSLPIFEFFLHGNPVNTFNSIWIRKKSDKVFFQQLFVLDMCEGIPEHYIKDKVPYFIARDMNFDGFLDIQLFSCEAGTANLSYSYWLYDPHLKKFVYNKLLSGLQNPKVIAESQTIETLSKDDCCTYYSKKYKYIDNQFELIEDVKTEYLAGSGVNILDYLHSPVELTFKRVSSGLFRTNIRSEGGSFLFDDFEKNPTYLIDAEMNELYLEMTEDCGDFDG